MLAGTYGWTHQDILQLTVRQFTHYLNEIPKVEARRQIKNLEAASYPYMEKRIATQTSRYYSRILQPLSQKIIDDNWGFLNKNKDMKNARRGRKRKIST